MKKRTFVTALVAFGALCGAASAQEAPAAPETPAPTVWTDPLHRFTMDFAGNGFTPPATRTVPAAALEVEHAALQRSANAVRKCTVTQARVRGAYASNQGDANARLFARTEQELNTALSGRLSDVRRARVEGISVLSFRLDTNSAQQFGRLFYLAQGGAVHEVAVLCGGGAPLTLLETTTMNQTLETLHFLPEAH